MEKNLFLLKQEEKSAKYFTKITNELISEVQRIIIAIEESNDKTIKENEESILYKKKTLEKRINNAIKKVNFNFTKLLLSKDLRRNVSYLQILVLLKRILNYTVESGMLMLKYSSKEYMYFQNNKTKKLVISVGQSLISVISELNDLLESESIESAEKLLVDSESIIASFRDFYEIVDFKMMSENDTVPHDERKKTKLFYSIFKIIHNFELISKDVDEIAKLIIYINNGKML